MMRALFWLLLLAGCAVAITLAARYNAGYVLLLLPPYRVELSLNLLIALMLAAFAALYLLLRVLVHALRLPSQVQRYRAERRQAHATASLLAALRAFLEGRYAQAEKAALEALGHAEYSGLAAVIAARSAHELRAYERRDRHLARAAYYTEADETMRTIAQAEVLLQSRQHQEALAALERLPHKHTAALRLELRAQQQARNWDRYLELLGLLERAQALEEGQAAEFKRYGVIESLGRKARDPEELRECWERLAPEERADPKIAAAAARGFASLGACEQALTLLEASLERDWDSALLRIYADCADANPVRQIERAERWLPQHSADPALLLALGRLCARARLWGKAKSYLEASVALDDSFPARLALARLLEAQGEGDGARAHYARALELAEAVLAPRPPALPTASPAEKAQLPA